MNSSGQLPLSDSAARRGHKSKARRRGRPRKQSASNSYANDEPELAAADSLTRTNALLLAALRVWELKKPDRRDKSRANPHILHLIDLG